MKKKQLITIFAAICILLSFTGCSKIQDGEYEATFLEIPDWKNVTREEALNSEEAIWEFEIDGKTHKLCVDCSEDNYSIPNILMNGHKYRISVEDNTVVSAVSLNASDFTGIVDGYEPGKRTLLNLLRTAAAPMGKTCYVYGGGWNFQDDGSSVMATTIGVFSEWENFFNTKDADYSNEEETLPNNGWNCYYYAGLDCSGYMGWVIYNTMNTESGTGEGFVGASSKMAKVLSEEYGFGSFRQYQNTISGEEFYRSVSDDLLPGDIISIKGHVYMVVGTCEDDSVMIIHSTGTKSVTGAVGGGVQLSAISCIGTEDTSCQAYQLACKYMNEHYPKWIARYPVVMKSADIYFDFSGDTAGIMSWNIHKSGLEDPEDIRNLSAADILELMQ